ncbi:hypothetical protein Pyn_00086 [Prunus yedoensis var. nudiflora]|uniref:Uncharacterized protein n=1 Tax=Prunus yedoensis var. nudiflora TaxID=2094558 RepID=A0A314UM13_PRUYE|nr:hypothetical protein Pyn_00086 [Prunus yedoensis var. nudiflora]
MEASFLLVGITLESADVLELSAEESSSDEKSLSRDRVEVAGGTSEELGLGLQVGGERRRLRA